MTHSGGQGPDTEVPVPFFLGLMSCHLPTPAPEVRSPSQVAFLS